MVVFQLLESVQGVQEAVGSNQAEEQPPLPPYPNFSDLSISGKEINLKFIRSIRSIDHHSFLR